MLPPRFTTDDDTIISPRRVMPRVALRFIEASFIIAWFACAFPANTIATAYFAMGDDLWPILQSLEFSAFGT